MPAGSGVNTGSRPLRGSSESIKRQSLPYGASFGLNTGLAGFPPFRTSLLCPGAAPPRPERQQLPLGRTRAHAKRVPTPSASTVGPGRGAVAPRPERQQLPLAGKRAREAGYTHPLAVAMVMGPDGARDRPISLHCRS